jgi:hypothetical protein
MVAFQCTQTPKTDHLDAYAAVSQPNTQLTGPQLGSLSQAAVPAQAAQSTGHTPQAQAQLQPQPQLPQSQFQQSQRTKLLGSGTLTVVVTILYKLLQDDPQKLALVCADPLTRQATGKLCYFSGASLSYWVSFGPAAT